LNFLIAFKILGTHWDSADRLQLSIRLKEVGVHEEWAVLTTFGDRGIGADEALGRGARWGLYDRLSVRFEVRGDDGLHL
jgi:hypothetical protein